MDTILAYVPFCGTPFDLIGGFLVVILVRVLARHYGWNLSRVSST